jgi:hypothetical protein
MIEKEIADLIRDLLSATENADSEGILNATLSLDSLKRERASEIKGHLNHYIENRSYQKALAFIEGEPGQ